MSVKLAILKSGETVISELKELVSDDTVCGYLFENPHIVQERASIFLTEDSDQSSRELEVSMSPWIILTKDTKIPIRPDWIVTIVEPLDSLIEMYEEKLNGQEHSMSSVEE
jgi:hypothetical protein